MTCKAARYKEAAGWVFLYVKDFVILQNVIFKDKEKLFYNETDKAGPFYI